MCVCACAHVCVCMCACMLSCRLIYALQEIFSCGENLSLLSQFLKKYKDQHVSEATPDANLTTEDFLKVLTDSSVVDAITKMLTK